jgi:hypothetical protein
MNKSRDMNILNFLKSIKDKFNNGVFKKKVKYIYIYILCKIAKLIEEMGKYNELMHVDESL